MPDANDQRHAVLKEYNNFLRDKNLTPAQHRPYLVQCNSGGFEMWRGGLGWHICWPTLSIAGVSLAIPYSVSTSRSSNRMCGWPASGFRTRTHAFAHGRRRISTGRQLHQSQRLGEVCVSG